MKNRTPPKHHIMCCEKRRLILFLTPKCGNTTIKDSILSSCLKSSEGLNRESEAGFCYIEPEDFTDEIRYSYTVICVLRHPAERLKSAWADKMSEDNRESFTWNKEKFHKGMTFSQFIHSVMTQKSHEMDFHIRPVYDEIISCGYTPSDIKKRIQTFAMEDVINDYTLLKQSLHETLVPNIPPLKHHNKSKNKNSIELDIEDIISKYGKDFDMWTTAREVTKNWRNDKMEIYKRERIKKPTAYY